MSASFREQIKKNDLLDIYSNIMDIVYFNIVDCEKELSVNVSKESYCTLHIKCKSVTSELTVIVNGIVIGTIKESGDTIIPLKLKYGDKICIKGGASGVFVGLTGGKFIRKLMGMILPLNSQYVTFGKNAIVYDINSVDDVLCDNLLPNETFENCIFVQTYTNNDIHYLGKLQTDSGVYFSTSVDNYTTAYKVLDCVPQDIVFLQDVSNGMIQFVYILDGCVYLKSYDNDMTLIFEEQIPTSQGKIARCLVASESCVDSPSLYAIVYDDGIDIMYLKNYANTQKIAEFCGKYLKIIEDSTSARFLILNDYSMENVCVEINPQETAGNLISISSVVTIDNVIDGFKFNDELKVISMGLDICNIDI